MPTIGKRAIVIGAGFGGLTTAAAIADFFEDVLVLERDVLPHAAEVRAGTPQARHVHLLLGGGQRALSALFPEFEDDLLRADAVPIRAGLDLRIERPGYDPFPQRDLGWLTYAQSRAQIEFTVRACLARRSNVAVRERCRVEALVADAGGNVVTGVQYLDETGTRATLPADLVVESSGRGDLTLALLAATAQAPPEVTTLGVDIAYSTATFAIPDDAPADWKSVFTFPGVGTSSRGALLAPLEGGRWILTAAGRHGDNPPGEPAGFMDFLGTFRTTTIATAVKHAKLLGDIVRFRFPESVNRHYERLATFPKGLLVLGDAICRFNPVYGQGMSVASMEAHALQGLLAARARERDPLDGLALAFFAEAAGLIETPWRQAAIPDLMHPKARGERPPDFELTLKIAAAFTKLAARDPDVHKLTAEVGNLLKPWTAYRDPELMQRVQAVMAES